MGTIERKERERENRKESIIDAAQKVFFDKGLLLSTMDEIAETAELAKGTLYLYYKSKEDLYLAVMMRGLSIMQSMFTGVIKKEESTLTTLLKLSDTYTKFYEHHKDYFRMLHYFQTPQFHKQVSDQMKQVCDSVTQELWGMVIAEIEKGITQKIIRAELNPVEVSLMLWSNAETMLMRIDSQYEMWKKSMKVDLKHTLRLSTALLIESVLTDHGKKEFKRLLKTRNR